MKSHVQGGPGAAAARHVANVEHGKHVGVRLLAGQADARAAVGGLVGGIDAHVSGAVRVDEPRLLGGAAIDVVDKAVGRVMALEEVEHVEELGARVVIDDRVACYCGLGNAQGEECGREMHAE